MAFKALNDPNSIGADLGKIFRHARQVRGIAKGQPWPFEMHYAVLDAWMRHGGPHIRETMERLKLRAQAAQASGTTPEEYWRELYPEGDGP